MAVKIQVSTIIDRPVAVVFDFFARDHVQNHPRWDPHMSLEKITDGPIGVGTIIRRRHTRTGKPVEGTMEITEFEPNRVFGNVIRDENAEMRGRVTFEPEGTSRTKLIGDLEIADMDEAMGDVLAGQIEGSFQNIKNLIEAETPG